VQNRAIEIHDSALDQVSLEGGVAELHFPEVYIHSSEGRPAIDAGTGWTQEAVIRIENARIEGEFPRESREAYSGHAHYLSDGSLAINGAISDNLIPIPLDVQGEIELKLDVLGYDCSGTRIFGEAGTYWRAEIYRGVSPLVPQALLSLPCW